MRVIGNLVGGKVIVLIDTGNTHNFLSQEVVQQLQIPVEPVKSMKVKVTSGEHMQTVGDCKSLLLTLQGHEFYMDFQVLPLHDYDIVLGTKWLSTLGSMLWNFQLMQMRLAGGKGNIVARSKIRFHLIDIRKKIM